MIMREFCIRVTWTFIIDMEKKRNGSKEWIDNDIDDATIWFRFGDIVKWIKPLDDFLAGI